MKYCSHCGGELYDEAVVCVRCGCSVDNRGASLQKSGRDETLSTVIKVFLIIGCIAEGWMIIPLAGCIPMSVSIFGKLKRGEPIGMALKICTLLFVSLVSGICLLCMDDDI